MWCCVDLLLAFSLFDKDRDGFITQDEVTSVMYALGVHASRRSIQQMFQTVDLDGQCVQRLAALTEMSPYYQCLGDKALVQS